MKRLLNAFFAFLPPVVGLLLILYLEGANPVARVNQELMIYAFVFAFLGAPLIVFHDKIANFSANWHSYRHSWYYRDADEAEEDSEEPLTAPKKKYRPTRLNYQLTFLSGIFVYVLGLAAIAYQVILLR